MEDRKMEDQIWRKVEDQKMQDQLIFTARQHSLLCRALY